MNFKTIFFAAMVAASAAANAVQMTGTGVANATVQAAGPRTGSNGTAFFNVEGSDNGNFANFGVVDFSAASFGAPANVAVNSATLNLTQSNTGFSLAATLHIYAASDTTTSISNVPGASPLKYQPGAANLGIGSQLGTLFDLGTGSYTVRSNGNVDAFTLDLSGAGTKAYFQNALTSGSGIVRIVIASENGNGAATYAGVTHSTVAWRPSLTLETQPVPEPASMAILGLGILGLARRRRSAK